MNWPGKIDNKGIPFVQMDGDQGCHPVCGTGCAQFFKQVKKCGKDLTEGFLYFFIVALNVCGIITRERFTICRNMVCANPYATLLVAESYRLIPHNGDITSLNPVYPTHSAVYHW